MPNWNEVLIEIKKEAEESILDRVRRKYVKELSEFTGRNVIAYYSGWLQKPGVLSSIINDNDKNGFMATIHQLDRSKGLDLLLHTPGGDLAATESIVDYLRKMFGTDIRVIIPQIAMSAGTMIACAGKEIIMGKQSNMGPIDPQFNGISADGVMEEFDRALDAVKKDPDSLPIWRVIIGKYHPTFIGDCEKAVEWSKSIVIEWLSTGMFKDDKNVKDKIKGIVGELSSHKKTSSHARHIPVEVCERIGLNIKRLEDLDPKFQDLVLTVHHSFMHTFSSTMAIKIIENQNRQAMVSIHKEKSR